MSRKPAADESRAAVDAAIARFIEARAEAKKRPRPTPAEAAKAVGEAVATGRVIVCYSTCWACKFDQHHEPPAPHPWWDSEDVEHAKATGQTEPTGNCACHCGRPTTEEPKP